MALAAATFFGTDTWNAEVYGSLSISSRLSALLKSNAAQLKLVEFFWKTNRNIESFLDKIDNAVRNAEKAIEKGNANSEPLNRAAAEKAIGQLSDLYQILDNIHQHCVRYRLNNFSRLAVGLNRLRRNADRVDELAAWLQDVLNPDFKDAFATARAEFENGETVPTSEACR
jgi:hypothetical protein